MLKEALARPYHSARKVFIIHDAESMTIEASNALLKVLEEPPAYVTFVLTATSASGIPETIVSRCQTIPFRKLPADALVEILVSQHGAMREEAAAAAGHADGDVQRALRILSRTGEGGRGILADIASGSPIELAHKYAKLEPLHRVDVLDELEIELVKRLRAGPGEDNPATGLLPLYRAVTSLRSATARLQSNVNPFLTFSVLFMDLSRLHLEGE